MKKALEIFIPVRVMATLVALIANSGIPAPATIPAGGYSKPVYSKLVEALFGAWERSDALWYFHLARDGYTPGSSDAVFMPLYPLLIRIVHFLTRMDWLFAGLLVSNLAFLFALRGFWELAKLELGEEKAEQASWYLALFPGSFFFLAPYTESLFLALAVYAILAARKGEWLRACVFGFFLSLTRNLGAAIALPLAVEFASQVRAGRTRAPAGGLLALPLLGPVLLSFYFFRTSGDPLSWIHHQDQWSRSFSPPWRTLAGGFDQAWDFLAASGGAVYFLEALSVLTVFVLLILSFIPREKRRLPLCYGVLTALLILPPLVAPFPGRMLMSATRFTAVIFPCFLVAALWVRKRSVDQAIRVSLGALYALALALFVSNQNMF